MPTGLSKSVGHTQTATSKEAKGRQLWLRKQDRTWLKIGRKVALGLERHDWESLGYANSRAWLQDTCPNSLSWIFQALKAVKVLRGVPDSLLQRLPREKSVELTRLPEQERNTTAKITRWVETAISAPTVADVRKSVNMARHTPDEPVRAWHLVVPESVFAELLAAEKKIADILRLDLDADRKLRIVVWSNIATLVNVTERERLVVEMQGVE